MRYFWLYPLVNIIVLIPHFCGTYFGLFISFTIALNNFSVIFHFSFLSFFIIRILPQKNEKKILIILYSIFLVFISFFIIKEPFNQGGPAFSISSLGLSIFCIFYYFQLFKNPPVLNLRKEPAFWIISGVFFAMCIHSPINAILLYLQNRLPYSYYILLLDLSIFSLSIMYLSFIKAILCTIQQKKV